MTRATDQGAEFQVNKILDRRAPHLIQPAERRAEPA